MGKHKRPTTDHVEPDLPITPMLDMSFQLMAFFILSFRPAPTEGQIALALPEQKGGPSTSIPVIADDLEKADEVVAIVTANANGEVGGITISNTEGGTALGGGDAGMRALQKLLTDKANAAGKKADGSFKVGKLRLEIGKELLHAHVVTLIDVAQRTGFTDISPEPMRGGGAK